MKKIEFDSSFLGSLNSLINTGAFLTVKSISGEINTMTISWGSIGCMWFMPVLMVMVRKSRYTYDLIEKSSTFSVSIPVNGQFKKELIICGSKSGKVINKFEHCNLEIDYIENFETPIIKGCDVNIFCKLLYKNPLDEKYCSQQVLDVYGKEKDFHSLYFGEIVSIIT